MTSDFSEVGGVSNAPATQGPKEDLALAAYHEKFAGVLVSIENQRYWLRISTFCVALIVIILAVLLELKILKYILTPCSQTEGIFVVLAVAPIASITLIVIFVLMGVFRGYREKDMGDLPTGTIGRMLGGNGS